jgi:uncharacterized protein involved in propanediol utilization
VSAMRVAAQIIPFGRGTGSCAGDQVAAHRRISRYFRRCSHHRQ